jgi:DNA-binding transcriptional MerR regulator
MAVNWFIFQSVMATSASLPSSTSSAGKEFTVDQLARAAGTTVRNVRAYQDRGLLEPPERRGRAGIYTEQHLSRLKIIGDLLGRGYTLASIGELFGALEQGHDIAQLLGLEHAVTSPWTDEVPQTYGLTDLVKMYGNFNPRWLLRASELGILVQDGARFRAPSPRLLQAGAELVKAGIPLDEMLEVVAQLRANVESAADDMVRLVEKHVFDRYGKGLPPPAEMPKVADVIWRLRPLVEMAVHAEVARAMEIAANKHIGDRLARILEQLTPRSPAGGP